METQDADVSASLWRTAVPRDALRFRYEDGAVVFSPRSWETQFLNEAAALMLDALSLGPHSAKDLLSIVAPSSSEITVQQVVGALEDMATLGLVQNIGDGL